MHSKEERLAALKNGLYGITAENWSRGRSNAEIVAAMIRGGVRIIQYREKDKSIREKYEECRILRQITAEAGVLFIVNDHIDIALAVGADGVHIGQDDLPPEVVRSFIGPEMLMGISTHSPEQAQGAVEAGADYIGVGPIYSTQTKVNVCAPVGLEYLEYAVRSINIPFVAIGGIKRHNLSEVIACGARCVCLVTEIVGAEDPAACVREIRDMLNSK